PGTNGDIALRLKLQAGSANDAIRTYQGWYHLSLESAVVATLNNTTEDLSPLFCYCLARRLDSPRSRDLALRREERAAVQYQHDPEAYDAIWQSFIPSGFRERSRQIYDRQLDHFLRGTSPRRPRR